MELTERADRPGGPAAFDWDLQVLALVSGAEIRVLSDSYSVDDDGIVFCQGAENADGPPYLYELLSVPLAVVELSPGGWPEFRLGPSAEAGLTSPAPPSTAPEPGARLYSVRLAPMRGHRAEVRVRAHGYRVADGALWFYFEMPPPGRRLDVASLSAHLVDGDFAAAVTEIGDDSRPLSRGPDQSPM